MGLLGKLKRKRDDEDDEDLDLDELEEESNDDDDGSSTGLLGRMRQKLKRSGGGDDDDDDDPAEPLDEDGGGSSGIFGRMRRKFKRDDDDEDEDDDELDLAPAGLAGGGDAGAIPVTVTSPPPDASVAEVDGEDQAAQTQGAAATAVYIVDGPEGDDAAPEENGEPVEEDAQQQDTAPESGPEDASGGKAGSSLDLSGIFENVEEVDEAFKDLVDSVGDVAASDLAIQLRELLSSLDKGS